MRALYFPLIDSFQSSNFLIVENDEFHHLVNVCRAKVQQEILLLNGKGIVAIGRVESINKKNAELSVLNEKLIQRRFDISLMLGVPKKDALEQCLQFAVELGINSVYLFRADFSQKFELNSKRIESILAAALIQSNNPWLPRICWLENSDQVKERLSQFDKIYLFDSMSKQTQSMESPKANSIIVIGPEGGFSVEESARIQSMPNVSTIHLPTPILKTPTAIACAIGFLLASL